MTHPIYTRDLLKNFSRSELHEVCDRLSISRRRSKEDCITDILAAQPQPVAHKVIEKPQDPNFEANYEKAIPTVGCAYAVNTIIENGEQPANLPQVNDTHLIGDFLLRCIKVGGDYVTVWDVSSDSGVLGEIRMDWNCFWTHTMSLGTFATPQEAVIDLYESLLAFLEEQRIQSEEPITFEKVADDQWESNVNGVLVRITSDDSGYKCNLTEDAVFTDYDTAIMRSLVAVAKLQEKRHTERAERANTVQVLSRHEDKFVVENSENSNRYVVCPNHLDPNQRCECADCRHRGSKCKHQIAVENFLKPSLIEQVKPKSCSVCWGSGELGDEDWLERCYYCDGKGTQKELIAA